MNTHIMTNIAFTKIIRVTDYSLEFNFRKLTADHLNFHADTTDPRGNRIQFSMYQDANGVWHASGTLLPLWITNSETTIGKAIEEEMSLV